MTKEPQRAPGAAPAPASNADKARALIALLESGGGAGAEGISASRLRDWARDLVETVERSAEPAPAPSAKPAPVPSAKQASAPASAATPAPAPPASAPVVASPAPAAPKAEPRLTATRHGFPKLFSKAAPVLLDRAPPAPPAAPRPAAAAAPSGAAAPSVAAPAAASPPAPRPAPASAAARTYGATRAAAARPMPGVPLPHVPARPQAPAAAGAAVLPRQEVDRIVAATMDPAGDPAAMAREHPAIVAMTLLGKPTLQQAAALRTLPGPQMRAVHRALRLLEARER